MACNCGCNSGSPTSDCSGCSGIKPSGVNGVGSILTSPMGGSSAVFRTGVGQAPSTTTDYMPWVYGAVAAVAAGGLLYAVVGHHGGMAHENPTYKKSPGAYQAAIANTLEKRYGFSKGKAYAAVNDSELGWKIAWLFQHNYNVSYATMRIHRAARRKLYGDWKKSGYMPLRKNLPPWGESYRSAAE